MKTLALLLVLILPTWASAEPLSNDVMEAFTQPLMAWLMRNHSELPLRITLPKVRFITHAEILRMTQGTELSRAMGTCYQGTVYLDERLNVTNVEHRSVLLHELVHYAQNNCAIPRDMAERVKFEDQAYALQVEWLHSLGR